MIICFALRATVVPRRARATRNAVAGTTKMAARISTASSGAHGPEDLGTMSPAWSDRNRPWIVASRQAMQCLPSSGRRARSPAPAGVRSLRRAAACNRGARGDPPIRRMAASTESSHSPWHRPATGR
jgi:hypothetical protein